MQWFLEVTGGMLQLQIILGFQIPDLIIRLGCSLSTGNK